MATFRIGDTVKVVSLLGRTRTGAYVGMIGVVDALGVENFANDKDCIGIVNCGHEYAFPPECLEPLTNPGQHTLTAADILDLPADSLTDFRLRPMEAA